VPGYKELDASLDVKAVCKCDVLEKLSPTLGSSDMFTAVWQLQGLSLLPLVHPVLARV